MKDAYGGILNLVLIVIFLLIVMGTLGLTVSYTKAFKMKNAVISAIENYEGSGCFREDGLCYQKIVSDSHNIHYSPSTRLNCSTPKSSAGVVDSGSIGDLFCYVKYKDNDKVFVQMQGTKKVRTCCARYYYDITTQVDMNIPIINQILGLDFFSIGGLTKSIVTDNCFKC